MPMNRLATLLICALLVPSFAGESETLPGPIPAELIRVVDGGTIHMRAHIWPDHSVDVMVRLEGIDAPEIHRPDCRAERALAEQAKTKLKTLQTHPSLCTMYTLVNMQAALSPRHACPMALI